MNNPFKKNKYKQRVFRKVSSVLLFSSLVACANLNKILPFKEINSQNIQPRVSFIDEQTSQVANLIKPSNINLVNVDKVIISYQRLLNRGNPAVRAEALHQLANISMRIAETKLADNQVLLNNVADQSLKQAIDTASFQQAIGYYQTLLTEFPEYTGKVDVNYQLARAYALNAEPESALQTLDKIATADASFSAYVESQFRRGESYFVRQQYAVAAKAYSEVLSKGKGTEFYDKALYKKGWSLFKQSLYSDAQLYFFQLYEKMIDKKAPQTSLNTDLLNDTKRVISLAFYNLDGVESIANHFLRQGTKSYENEIYTALAELYLEQERYQDAANTYKGYIAKHPLSLYSPELHSHVINIYRQGGFPSLILPEKESFVTRYGRLSQFWSFHNEQVRQNLKPLLKQHLDDISGYYHATAQKSKKPNDYLVAAKWYREILATFEQNGGVNTDNLTDSKYRFLLAETLSAGMQPALAAKEYEVVAYKNQHSTFSRDAAYRALVAYGNVKYPAGSNQIVRLLPSITSGLKFSEGYPSDPEAAKILARVTEQQLQLNDVKAAISSSEKLLLLPIKYAGKYQLRARIIIANGLFDLKQYLLAEKAISQLLVGTNLNKQQRLLFRQRRVEALYKLAEKERQENNNDKAIALFLKVKQLEPKFPIAVNAHYDAATLLLQTKQWQQASVLLVAFRQTYPKHMLTESIAEKLALVYENQSDWNRAAAEYKKLASKQKDANLAREGYWRVAELYLKANNQSEAISAFKYYSWTYPSPYLLAQEARNHLVELYSNNKTLDKVVFWQKKLIEFYNKNSKLNNTRMDYFAAKYSFDLAEPLFRHYQQIKLTLPLAKNLKSKRNAMKKALQQYNKIAEFNVAEFTTASTHRVALIYQILSDDLMASQRPKGLDEDELEEYGYLLEDQALPFEDKAIGFFEINAQRTQQQLYDQSIRASIESLKKLKPAHYDKNEILMELDDVLF